MEIKLNDFLDNINQHVKPDKEVFIIAIAGGSGSGKSFLGQRIAEKLDGKIFSMDDYIDGEKVKASDNWDLPEIWQLDKIRRDLEKLKSGKGVKKPVYDFSEHGVVDYVDFSPERIIILEGLYGLHKDVLDLIDLKIFVDASEEVRLKRRVDRDVAERGRTEEQILKSGESLFNLLI